jgi:hypothetical protein
VSQILQDPAGTGNRTGTDVGVVGEGTGAADLTWLRRRPTVVTFAKKSSVPAIDDSRIVSGFAMVRVVAKKKQTRMIKFMFVLFFLVSKL